MSITRLGIRGTLFALCMASSLCAFAERYRCDDGTIITGGDCPDGGISHLIADDIAIPHRRAEEVTPRRAPAPAPMNSEQQCNFAGVSSTPPDGYTLQELHVSGLACQGVSCEINQEVMDYQAKININGGSFAAYQGSKLALTIVDSKTRRIVSRRAFFLSYGDGSISTWIEATQMPSGVFSFGITPMCNSNQVLASGRFAISRVDHHGQGGSGGKGPKFDPFRYCSPNCFYFNPTINIH